jgi:hypothetical protein
VTGVSVGCEEIWFEIVMTASSHFEITGDLLGLERLPAGLHFNESPPNRFPAFDNNGAVRNVDLSVSTLQLNLGERTNAPFGRAKTS